MTIIGLIRLTRGVVRFEVRDGFIERFINLCAQGGVPIWDGRRVGQRYTACTTVKGSSRLADCAARAGVTLQINKKEGVPPLFRRYRKRSGLFLGAVVLLAAVSVMGSFIWQIQVSGNETIPAEEVLSALEELGVRPGVWRKSIDARDVERQMMIRLDKVGWIGVNLKGSTAYIEISERVAPPVRIDDTTPYNVVATKTGHITYMEVYAGQAMVKVGDSVAAGDILVSGIMEDKAGKNRLVHARAKILAQTEEILEVTIPYEQEYLTLRQIEKRCFLTLFGLKIPLYFRGPPEDAYRHETAAYDVAVLSRLMPLSYHKDFYFLVDRHTKVVTLEKAMDQAREELGRMESLAFEQIEIIERYPTGQELEKGFWLESRYVCREDIAREVEILLEGYDLEAYLSALDEASALSERVLGNNKQ